MMPQHHLPAGQRGLFFVQPQGIPHPGRQRKGQRLQKISRHGSKEKGLEGHGYPFLVQGMKNQPFGLCRLVMVTLLTVAASLP